MEQGHFCPFWGSKRTLQHRKARCHQLYCDQFHNVRVHALAKKDKTDKHSVITWCPWASLCIFAQQLTFYKKCIPLLWIFVLIALYLYISLYRGMELLCCLITDALWFSCSCDLVPYWVFHKALRNSHILANKIYSTAIAVSKCYARKKHRQKHWEKKPLHKVGFASKKVKNKINKITSQYSL